jgi:imidazoleglycerol-phosphate dehydratase
MDNKRGYASIARETGETNIKLELDLYGEGKNSINTGVGFLDHMLNLMATHGFMNLNIEADGDLYVDCHHTVEDIGITFGLALKEALGDKKGIRRYGNMFLPMDEAMAHVAVDISGRPFLVFEGEFTCEKLGHMDTEMVEEFFRAVAFNSGLTLHARVLYGKNNHHMVEALFKAFGRALREAISIDDKVKGVMSTKGIL